MKMRSVLDKKGQAGIAGLIGLIGVLLITVIYTFVVPFIAAVLFDAGSSQLSAINSTDTKIYGNLTAMEREGAESARDTFGIFFSVISLAAVFSVIAMIRMAG